MLYGILRYIRLAWLLFLEKRVKNAKFREHLFYIRLALAFRVAIFGSGKKAVKMPKYIVFTTRKNQGMLPPPVMYRYYRQSCLCLDCISYIAVLAPCQLHDYGQPTKRYPTQSTVSKRLLHCHKSRKPILAYHQYRCIALALYHSVSLMNHRDYSPCICTRRVWSAHTSLLYRTVAYMLGIFPYKFSCYLFIIVSCSEASRTCALTTRKNTNLKIFPATRKTLDKRARMCYNESASGWSHRADQRKKVRGLTQAAAKSRLHEMVNDVYR